MDMNVFAKRSGNKSNTLSETAYEVPHAVDAIIHISIADNGLRAYLNMEPPRNGGAAPAMDELKAALSEHNISFHVDFEKLKSLEANPIYNQDIIIANGLAPVDGVDGTATFRIRTVKSGLRPKSNENGTVDYHDLDIVENVKEGQILCTITLPTEGTPGITVQGKALPQRKGRPIPSYLGRNTEFNEDGTAILSKIDGQVEFNGNKINVDETFYVKENVDNSTGNIHVTGNLVIPGIVLPGFTVEAGGNIEIRGTVENSTIKAGGNIKLKSGITGGELYCGGDLWCRFIENSNILVKGDINTQSIINSTVKCGKNIKVSGMIAKIIGGSCVAGQNIEAHTIGSAANVMTRLELGTDQTVIERQQELSTQTAELEAQINKLNPLIVILRQLEASNRLTPEKRQAFDNVNYSYDNSTKLLEEAKRELKEIVQSIKVKGFGRIICAGTIYPGTKVVIGEASLVITDPLNNAALYYNKGDIGIGAAR